MTVIARGVGRLNGCGTPIKGGECGHDGLCVRCWAIDNDEHVPTLRAQLKGAVDALVTLKLALTAVATTAHELGVDGRVRKAAAAIRAANAAGGHESRPLARDEARCQHCVPSVAADERSFMCEDCAGKADEEVQALRDQLHGAVSLSRDEWSRVLGLLHRRQPPGPFKALDEAIIDKINRARGQ